MQIVPHGCSSHLERAGQQVAVVRQAGGKGRAIVEAVLGLALRPPQLLLERVNLLHMAEQRLVVTLCSLHASWIEVQCPFMLRQEALSPAAASSCLEGASGAAFCLP